MRLLRLIPLLILTTSLGWYTAESYRAEKRIRGLQDAMATQIRITAQLVEVMGKNLGSLQAQITELRSELQIERSKLQRMKQGETSL